MKSLKIILSLFFALACYVPAGYGQKAFNMVKDIFPGNDCQASEFTEYNGKVYFSAEDSIHGLEPWVTDGTPAGTHMLKDVNTIVGHSSYPAGFTVYNNKLYFNAGDYAAQSELWVTDGSDTGTKKILTLDMFGPKKFPILHNRMFFEAYDVTHGAELWSSDGTDTGTRIVKDINKGKNNSGVGNLIIFNNKLYFTADDGTHGMELWATDGTDSGTHLVKDINPFGSSNPADINDTATETTDIYAILNNKLYFPADDGVHGFELWVTDGTAKGTAMVKDINPNGGSLPGFSGGLFVYKDSIYFDADSDGNGKQYLWTTDGTTTGTFFFDNYQDPIAYYVYNNKLFFDALDYGGWWALRITDGTKKGTTTLKDRQGNYRSGGYFNIINNKLYFASADYGLWVTDGTDTSTRSLKPDFTIHTIPLYDSKEIFGYNNTLLFRAQYTTGYELWSLDPSLYIYTNIEEPETSTAQNFKVWPNPVIGNTFDIANKQPEHEGIQLQLQSIEGKTILQESLENAVEKIPVTLPEELPAGLYILSLTTHHALYTQKIIVQK